LSWGRRATELARLQLAIEFGWRLRSRSSVRVAIRGSMDYWLAEAEEWERFRLSLNPQ
jgi:hypothetical protein